MTKGETALTAEPPHYLGHRERLRDRFRKGGADALGEYELRELILFRAMPRLDVMPGFISCAGRLLYPILGSRHLDRQLRKLNSNIHVYGHSHVNRQVTIDGVSYINNAFGYPSETRITSHISGRLSTTRMWWCPPFIASLPVRGSRTMFGSLGMQWSATPI